MYPYYYGYKENMLEEDDIGAITALYPAGEGAVFPIGSVNEVDGQVIEIPKIDTSNDVCIPKFTAGVSDPTGDYIYLFYGQFYIRLEPMDTTIQNKGGYWPKVSEGFPFVVADKWPGLVGPFDAAVTDYDGKLSYFFSDGKVSTWDWFKNSIGDLYEEPIGNTMFSGLPEGITAVGRYRGDFIFFTADRYYIFSLENGLINPEGHPSPDGGADDIASAFSSFFNGYMYLTPDQRPGNYHLVRSTHLVNGGAGVDTAADAKASAAAINATANEYYFDMKFHEEDSGVMGWNDFLKFDSCE